eukprot:CAMPEP_0180775538 /NCGR_PEP_ID=MMETSP1038_2-20121128/44327_1 /TAXON_ID=632150 /ORGANISM="Azadinium spinosum, Strain 3D9" /LENGTH=40 /DNA_ID= /DNA_START= /DNA_END= /DNA_ORIENTATION=
MSRATSVLLIIATGAFMAMHFQQQTFVPPALRRAAPVVVP